MGTGSTKKTPWEAVAQCGRLREARLARAAGPVSVTRRAVVIAGSSDAQLCSRPTMGVGGWQVAGESAGRQQQEVVGQRAARVEAARAAETFNG
jgi:hypothetical protein